MGENACSDGLATASQPCKFFRKSATQDVVASRARRPSILPFKVLSCGGPTGKCQLTKVKANPFSPNHFIYDPIA